MPTDVHLSVKNPLDEGEPLEPHEKDALFIGLLRLHIANLIRQLGHVELADALYRLTRQPFARRLQGDIDLARILLDEAPVGEMDKAATFGGLVGGIITRAGPVADAGVTSGDQEMLAHLNLRPVFVGVERDLIRAAIDAEPQAVRTRLTQSARPDDFARPDRAGGWIVPLGACAPSCEPTNSRPCQRCNGAIVWLIKKAQHVPVRWPNVQNSGMLSTETAPQCVNSKLRYLPCQIRSQNRSR